MNPYAFTSAQVTDIRRYCGYGSIGADNSNFQNWRFFREWGLLEYRIQHCTQDEGAVVATYLANLNSLETAIWTTSANLATDQAAVWTHNKHEMRDRKALYDMARRELCAFFGLPPGPGLQGPSGLALVV